MKKRFVVGINLTSEDDEKRLASYLKKTRYGWWHWIKNFWLIIDGQGTLTATQLRDEIIQLFPSTNLFVIELKDKGTWAGMGPTNPIFDMFKWIREGWDKES